MHRHLMLLVICLAALMIPVSALSQDEEKEYTFGNVVEIMANGGQLVIEEYDTEKDGMVNNTYKMAADAEFENASSLNSIKKGDEVDLEYYMDENGQRVVTYISVYEMDKLEENETEEDGETMGEYETSEEME